MYALHALRTVKWSVGPEKRLPRPSRLKLPWRKRLRSLAPETFRAEHSMRKSLKRSTLINAIGISFGLLITLFAILLLYKMRKLKPQVAGFGSQRMCPSCGLIISLEGRLLGVWQVSYSGERNPNSREIERRLSPQPARFWSSEIRSMNNKGDVRC